MKKTFEEFLKEECFKINSQVLDDDMPDFFDNWLGELDGEDYLKWGDLMQQLRRERRNRKIKMILFGLAGVVGMWIIWNFVQLDFCEIYYKIKCFS